MALHQHGLSGASMPSRYLFGPVSPAFARENLGRQREQGSCLAFDAEGQTDLTVQPSDSWAKLSTRFPARWKPDFLVLNLPYAFIPEWLWTAPVPIIGIATDWPLLWHYYRRRVRQCDLVLTDPAGIEV